MTHERILARLLHLCFCQLAETNLPQLGNEEGTAYRKEITKKDGQLQGLSDRALSLEIQVLCGGCRVGLHGQILVQIATEFTRDLRAALTLAQLGLL